MDYNKTFKILPISEILPDIDQPRKYFEEQELEILMHSIKERGVINPILVEKIKKDKYLLIDGERRFRATLMAKIKNIPVNIIDETLTPTERDIIRFQMQETNSQWNMFEKAESISKINIDLNSNNQELAKTLGMSTMNLSRYLKLLKMSKNQRQIMTNLKLSISYADIITLAQNKLSIELKQEYPDFIQIICEKIKIGAIKNFKEIKEINRLLQYKEFNIVKQFLEDEKMTPDQAIKKSKRYRNENINDKLQKRIKALSLEIKYFNENPTELDEITTSALIQMMKALKDLVK